jgi:hypothetical protein
MTITEAIQNVDNVLANVALNRQQHITISESMKLIIDRCKIADQLEGEKNVKQPQTDV